MMRILRRPPLALPITLLLAAAALAALAEVSRPTPARAVGLPAAHAAGLRSEPTATRFWQVDGATIRMLFRNGQCTMWAQERRPDIVRRGVEAIVAAEIARHEPEQAGDWDARNWPAIARLAHLRTGHAPRRGALAVFAPGTLGAGRAGHIAYVERVLAGGAFVVSQMDAPVRWRVTRRHLSAADGRLRGVTFIY